jgi:hypothetical protein
MTATAVVTLSQERCLEQFHGTLIDCSNQAVERPQLILDRTDFVPFPDSVQLVLFKFGRGKFSKWATA